MNNTNIIQSAAVNGLILSLVTILSSLISVTITPTGFLSILLWLLKLGVTIYLLYYFMKKRSQEFEVYTYGNSFLYGFLICLFSSIACTAYMVLQYTVIFPDLISGTIEQVVVMWEQMGVDYSSIGGGNLEQFLLKSMYIIFPFYYLLWGVILSLILAASTKRNNIYTYED